MSITLDQITEYIWPALLIIFGSTCIVQIAPIKINPWSAILKGIGNLLNSGMQEKVDEISNKVNDIESRVIQHEEERDKDKALDARRRILRFADECIRKDKHSKEFFNNVMDDITLYKYYCDTHPSFQNEQCVMSIEVIEKAYRHCVDENGFL